MTTSRYSSDARLGLGSQLGTYRTVRNIRSGVRSGTIPIVDVLVTTGDDRLDTLSGTIYGDARYWWVLAAASDIGWGMQVPAGTIINVIRLSDAQRSVI